MSFAPGKCHPIEPLTVNGERVSRNRVQVADSGLILSGAMKPKTKEKVRDTSQTI